MHVIERRGRGVYIDLHGHGHAVQRLELGYLINAADLESADATLTDAALVRTSSLRTLAELGPATHAELVRGSTSLGTLFELEGYPAVPSTVQPHPGGLPYFTGGYSTERHGSASGGPIDGVQIEANMDGVRDSSASRAAFAMALAQVVATWFDMHYGGSLAAATVH
jgi:hypothetical protein